MLSLGEAEREQFFPVVLPRLCLNRYYLAEGFIIHKICACLTCLHARKNTDFGMGMKRRFHVPFSPLKHPLIFEDVFPVVNFGSFLVGVRIYSQNTWKEVVGQRGCSYVQKYLQVTVLWTRFYPSFPFFSFLHELC